MTAVTLAGRAANLISQGADVLIFQGQEAVEQHPLFAQKKVRLLSGNAGTGLLNGLSGIQIVEVDPSSVEGDELRFGEKTFEAVAKAYSRLQSGTGLAQAHYGPYALVLNFVQYADSLAPLEKTLIMPADRITSLVEFYGGTGTLPPFTGLLVSTGGNTMDLVVGIDVMTTFLQEDPDGRYRFRVYERFALRLKDETARIRLDFQQQVTNPTKSKRLAQAVGNS